jgi:hypothetical protein
MDTMNNLIDLESIEKRSGPVGTAVHQDKTFICSIHCDENGVGSRDSDPDCQITFAGRLSETWIENDIPQKEAF